MPADKKPSAVEVAKSESRYLSGEIAPELTDGKEHFGKDSVQLLKHHGIYQQDDRDTRSRSEAGKSERHFRFMVRTKIPGGELSSEQLLAELDLCDEIGNQTLRVTTRQGLQLHGVLKDDLKRTIAAHQRSQDVDAGGVRRRGTQRDVLARAVQTRSGAS